jgi:hypothetical protein
MPLLPLTTRRRSAGLRAGLAACALTLCLAGLSPASADEADAKALLKAMADYLSTQQRFSFSYDTSFEVVTAEQQKLQVAASGTMVVERPDKLRATRHGGFANVEMVFDGQTFTIFGKDANLYVQTDAPGSIDQLIDTIRERLHKAVPGGDLLMANPYDELMAGVTDVKDLGSGVIRGQECDYLAFRTAEVDWQIWIHQGAEPYPCRYVITSVQVDQAPQYTLELSDWKAGSAVAATDFGFEPPAGARLVTAEEAKMEAGLDDMPSNFKIGGAQ